MLVVAVSLFVLGTASFMIFNIFDVDAYWTDILKLDTQMNIQYDIEVKLKAEETKAEDVFKEETTAAESSKESQEDTKVSETLENELTDTQELPSESATEESLEATLEAAGY